MRKSIYLWSLALASVFATGCSQDDIQPGDTTNEGGVAENTTSYISIKLSSTDLSGTRALGGYEYGTDDENKVSNVRFYFFTASGAPANVRFDGTNYVNFLDWKPDGQTNEGNVNVASKLSATIVINTSKGDKLPQQLAAVINPTFKDAGSRTLQELKREVKDYADKDYTSSGKFVMFNSVYGNENETAEICAVPIAEGNLKLTSQEAIDNPVTIYVERCVAKVNVTIGEETGYNPSTGIIALKDAKGYDLKVNGEQVYLKINGWDLTAETTVGSLGKSIKLDWTYDWWNSFKNKRSCWAINAESAENTWYSYNQSTPAENNIGMSMYTNENAENFTGTNAITNNLADTKVFISGTLCKRTEEGKYVPFTIVRHLGAHFADNYSATESENLTELKKNILSQLEANGKHFYYKGNVTVDGETKEGFIGIGIDDLKIVIATQEAKEDSDNNCYVYAELTDSAKDKTWYASNDKDATPIVEEDAVNKALAAVDKALVWNSGMTYYYFAIRHNTVTNGDVTTVTNGVVRNHVYKTNVTKIAGLGTPVYDPTQKIYPETPNPNEHFIAAQINILAWHIVSDNYELEW